MPDFKPYRVLKSKQRRVEIVEFRPWVPGESLDGVELGGRSPADGDVVARNPNHHAQQWLVSASDFANGHEPA